MHCPSCNSYRPSNPCWKCNTTTIIPIDNWEYPKLPDVNRIRELAKEVGYAIGEHGSKERDLDLIAAPWTEKAVAVHELLVHVANGINASILDIEYKPLGRVAATIQINGYFKPIDISVMPRKMS